MNIDSSNDVSYSASDNATNPATNQGFLGQLNKFVDLAGDTYTRILQARMSANNPPANRPPGTFSYSPQNDGRPATSGANAMPGLLPAGKTGLYLGGGIALAIVVMLMLVMRGGR